MRPELAQGRASLQLTRTASTGGSVLAWPRNREGSPGGAQELTIELAQRSLTQPAPEHVEPEGVLTASRVTRSAPTRPGPPPSRGSSRWPVP